jgi:hypothetical protein
LLEDGFNHQNDLFNLYKDSGELIEKYDQTMALLLKEGPQISSSIDKLKSTE